MKIFFGENSLENYQQNRSIVDCIPINNFQNWIKIDPDLKTIQVKLK